MSCIDYLILKGYRVVALIDGDGVIFSNALTSQGRVGGLAAAQKLNQSIVDHFSETYGPNPYQLRVYVFFNKRGLMETYGRMGMGLEKYYLEDFVMGFNQAADRFLMVDVGNAKEAADAKIKGVPHLIPSTMPELTVCPAHLEDEIRLPQTFKVIFGGQSFLSWTHDRLLTGH